MRAEDDLVENVDATRHSIRATERARASSNGQRPLHSIPILTASTEWWRKYFQWENLTVAGRNLEKGFVLTPTIAAVLLAAFIGAVGWAYKSNTSDQRDTRDAIIEMKTLLNERTQTFKEQQAEIKNDLATERRVAELQREKQRDEMRDVKAAMSQKGIRLSQ